MSGDLAAAAARALAAEQDTTRREHLVTTARATLTTALDGWDTSTLRLVATDDDAGFVVLHDPSLGQLYLAVTLADTVALVERAGPREWTRLADVTSLADLGRALAEHGA